MAIRGIAVFGLVVTAHGCTSDHDCSLNGVCDAGECHCDAPWSEASCGVLVTEPARNPGIYGYSPNVSSWGGNVVAGDDGLFHLFVAEVPGGLKHWHSASQCVHAVSQSMAGPFEKADVSLNKWCHNPAPIRDSNGEYLLFHIGEGDAEPTSGFLHHSKSPTGPWTPAKTMPNGTCNNPAPAFHPNGTLFMICHHMFITSAATWEEEWQPLRSLNKSGGDPDRHWEDPTLWFDRRGNFHILYHVYCLLPYSAHKECYSGHAFSADGFDWTFSEVEPFGGQASLKDGSSMAFSTRERPQVIFAPGDSTTPVGFVGAVSTQPVGPTCDSCGHHSCSQCKTSEGRDWTFTFMQPLQGFSEAYPEEQLTV